MGEDILDFRDRCRLCIEPKRLSIDIFSEEGRKIKLKSKINKHLTLQVSRSDGLPSHICYQCLFRLETWVNFKHLCMERDKVLKTWSFMSHNDSQQFLGESQCEEEDLGSAEHGSGKVDTEQVPAKSRLERAQESPNVLDMETHTPDIEASLGSYTVDSQTDDAVSVPGEHTVWDAEDEKAVDVDMATVDSLTSELMKKINTPHDSTRVQRVICAETKEMDKRAVLDAQAFPDTRLNPERSRRKPVKPNKMECSRSGSVSSLDADQCTTVESVGMNLNLSTRSLTPKPNKGPKTPSPKPYMKGSPNGSPQPIKRKRGRPSKASLLRERELKLEREREKQKQVQAQAQLVQKAKAEIKIERNENEVKEETPVGTGSTDYSHIVKEDSGITEIVLDDPEFGSMKFTLSVIEIDSPVTSPTPIEDCRHYPESCTSSCGHTSSDSQAREDFEGFESPVRFSPMKCQSAADVVDVVDVTVSLDSPHGPEENDKADSPVNYDIEEKEDFPAENLSQHISQEVDLSASSEGETSELCNFNEMPRSKSMVDVSIEYNSDSLDANITRKRSSSCSGNFRNTSPEPIKVSVPGIHRLSISKSMEEMSSLCYGDSSGTRKRSMFISDNQAYSDGEIIESPSKRQKKRLLLDETTDNDHSLLVLSKKAVDRTQCSSPPSLNTVNQDAVWRSVIE